MIRCRYPVGLGIHGVVGIFWGVGISGSQVPRGVGIQCTNILVGVRPTKTGTGWQAGGTHPTGMLSCFRFFKKDNMHDWHPSWGCLRISVRKS